MRPGNAGGGPLLLVGLLRGCIPSEKQRKKRKPNKGLAGCLWWQKLKVFCTAVLGSRINIGAGDASDLDLSTKRGDGAAVGRLYPLVSQFRRFSLQKPLQ
jgi:hypothetical protein